MKNISYFFIALGIVCFTASIVAVNYYDKEKTELALKSGYVQCFVDNKVLWKKDCKE